MSRDRNILILVIVSLLVTLPCLLHGFPFYGDDSISNAILYREFARQFWSGELYPRWLQDLNGGLGNPTGFYYPPLSYWLTSCLRPLFKEDPLRQLGLSAVFAVVASGIAVYYWLVRIVDSRAARAASLVYMILPYHLNIDLYARGALAELWSFVWMPLVLCAVDAVIARRRLAVVGLACAYALLVMTHLPTTLTFSLVPLTYSFYIAPIGERVRALLMTTLAMFLGAGVSAIYLLPAILMQDFIFHTTQGIGGHYYFGNWFLFSGLKWSGKYSEYFVASLGVMVLAGIAFAISRVNVATVIKKRSLFWFAVACSCFFLMTPLSKPIWILLPTLQKIQFPFRFNTALSLAATSLVAFVWGEKTRRVQTVFLIVLSLLVVTWIYGGIRRAYYSYPTNYVDQTVVEGAIKRQLLRRDTNEFRPRWVASIEEHELDALLSRIGRSQGELRKVNVIDGQASVEVDKWAPREIILRVDTTTGATLNISQFYFPGWTLLVEGTEAARAVEPSTPGGLISVKAPVGNHRLILQLRKRLPELAGQIVSILSLFTVMVLVISSIQRR